MARQNPIQTTYDPSIYNEGIILQKDGSILTKPINEDGTPNISGQQTVTEPGKGVITINQTVNGSTSTYSFNVNQKENQTINLPTVTIPTIPYYSMATERFESSPTSVTLSHTAIGKPSILIFIYQQGNVMKYNEVHMPSEVSGSGRNWSFTNPVPASTYGVEVNYLYRTQ